MVALRDMAELQAVRQRPAVLRWRSSHLPDALGRLIGSMLVTPKGLAAQLGISLQAALGILWTLQAEGVVREVTGHASFRAFSLKL